MTYAEFKKNFLPELLKIKSFRGKMDYANQNLQRIGSGTGRVVYDIDGEKVLKLAKNPKGIAQNETEAGIGYYKDSQNIVAIVFDSADDDNWLIAEKAKKVNETRIKQLTGIPSLNDLFFYLRNWYSSNNGRGNIFHQEFEMIEQLNENDFVQELIEFIANYGQQPGDYGRPSTYGEVLRDGQPTIVITDYGLNDEVYDTHYAPKKEKYGMYEMYNFADGNDDMLGDMPPQDAVDTRQGMWALMPYGVGDGPGVVNEDFISFVLNRDKYPTRALPSAPYLVDEFHNCVNNLNEVLNHAGDKKKFYNNLLELQDYLIRGKFYDREPLEKEIVETTHKVQPMSLEKDYSSKIASAFAAKLNLGEPQYLGGGGYGYAYLINDNKVLKITTDTCEVDAGLKIQRGKPKTLVYVYNIYKIIDSEKNISVYALIEEHIANKPIDEFLKYVSVLNEIQPNPNLYGNLLIALRKKKFDEYVELSQKILTDNSNINVSQADRENAYHFMMGLFEIKKELIQLQIKSDDYSNLDNLGYKDGILTYFDIGGCFNVVREPQLPPEDRIILPESKEVLDEVTIKKDVADSIANQVAQKYNYGMPKYIDSGVFGAAYDIGNNMVLKVTSDRSEANENLELIGKPLKYIAEPYKVFSVKPKSGETEIYVIILEKLRTDPTEFRRLLDRMNFAFGKIMGIKFSDVVDHYVHGYDYDDGVDEAKVEKYMSKNPEDAKYFQGTLKIAEEVKHYGIESMDYLNSNNLGYKKDGSLGFFDVGFGNYFFQSNNQPEELQIDEDGTALYSTENSFGQDNFPVHNNDDTSLSIQNDLNANSAISEDLEYNHVVGDATKDKYEITERVKSYMPGSQSVEVKKKCRLAGNGNTSTACNQGDINNLNLKSINEMNGNDPKDFWAWVSPDNQLIKVPVLNHKDYIMNKYKDQDFGWDYERVFEQAMKDGWVRVTYEYNQSNFSGSLALNGYNKDRVKQVFKDKFYSLVQYGNNSVYIDYENPEGSEKFSTRDGEGKAKLVNYITEEVSQSFEKQIGKDNATHQLDKVLIRTYSDGIDVNPVYAVNGDEVRDSGFIEWVDGGNHWVDADLPREEQKYAKHIPKDDFWIDDVFLAKPNDFEAILLHERTESFLIKHYGYTYDDAHEIANKIELFFRKKTENISDDEESEKVASVIYAAFKKNFKSKGDKEFRNEGVADVAAEKQFGIEPPHQDFEDKFARDQKEEEIVYTAPDNYLVIIKNPKRLDSIFGYARGVIDPEGNLYIEQRATKIHIDILYELGKLGLIKDNNYWDSVLPKDFVTVQRYLRTNKILLGESNAPMILDNVRPTDSQFWREIPSRAEAEPIYQRFLDKAKQKTPIFEFINELLQYYAKRNDNNKTEFASGIQSNLNEAEIMSLQNLPFKQEVENLGGKIYGVGGAVRDELLGKESKDLDVLITGVPFEQLEQILGNYGRVDAVGKSFGVLKFKLQGTSEEIDIAIPRTETASGEGGHQGFDVKSDHALPIEKDLERRDFTINAIAKDSEGNVVDPYGGQEDLKNKIIRVVNPQAFSDDPLRMLRAVQFASRFGFTIEPETMQMIKENVPRVKEIAPERILTEFDKIIKKGNILTGAELLMNTGLYSQIFGNGNARPKKLSGLFTKVRTMGEFIYLLAVGAVQNQNPAEFYKSNLKGDIPTYKEIRALELAFDSGEATNLIEARSVAHNMYVTSPQSLESQIIPNTIKTAAQELLQGKYPKTINELAVRGEDLMQLGLEGKAIGDMQKSLLLKIYADKVRNTKEDLLNLAGQNKGIIKEEVEGWGKYRNKILYFGSPSGMMKVSLKNVIFDKNTNTYQIEMYPNASLRSGEAWLTNMTAEELKTFVDTGRVDYNNAINGGHSRLTTIAKYDALQNAKNLYGFRNTEEIKEEISDKIEYGTLLLFLDVPIWERITSIINKNDIYDEPGYGIETEPHVTILYGFHDEVTADEVFGLVKESIPLKPIEVRIAGISIFSNPKFDVVKFDVKSEILTKLNGVVKQLPNTVDFPIYRPHITIGFVKAGEGQKYVKAFEKERIIKGTELIFSTKGHKGNDGEKLMLGEGIADRYAEKAFNIPNPNAEKDVQAGGEIQKTLEEPISYVTKDVNGKIAAVNMPIYENPKSLANFGESTRAIVDLDGNLFVVQRNGWFNHGDMAQALGFTEFDDGIYENMEEYQLLNRIDSSNSFGLADSSAEFAEDEYNNNNIKVVNKILRAAKRKNPQYDFYNQYFSRVNNKPISLNEYLEYPEIVNDKYLVNGEPVDINFFVHKYGEWNAGERFRDPSKESVLRFLEDDFEGLVNNEKLKKELLWALTDRDVLNENAMGRVSYSAVVLDEKSRSRLLERFKSMIPEGWKVIADHVTINMGEIDPEYQKYLGLAIRLSVIDVAIDDKVMAVGVEIGRAHV